IGERRGAVMLVHGLGANRFSLHCEGRSLAAWLATRGFECFVPELRGAGESERPKVSWDLDDYLERDVPALLEAVTRRALGPVDWVGHSLGGVLLLLHAI